MTDFESIAETIYYFLKQHGVETSRVRVILRADDERTEAQIAFALATQLPNYVFVRDAPFDIRGFDVHGIRFAVTSLDNSRAKK